MQVGVQFSGTVPADQTQQWMTTDWPPGWHVVWSLVPTSPAPAGGAPQLSWEMAVERAAGDRLTYWITVQNLTSDPVQFQARYAVVHRG